MRLDGFVTDIARSAGFLGRIPVPARFFIGHDGNMARAARAFPAAGLLLSMPAATILWLLLANGAASGMSAIVAVVSMVLCTGALHEDGLADTADGLGGGRDREHMLAIMKDSRIGTYGAIALMSSLAVRASAISAIADVASPAATAMTFMAAEAFSRALMVWHWNALPPARPGGVAASVGQPDTEARNTALITGIVLAAFLLMASGFGMIGIIFCTGITAIAVSGFNRFILRRIGGHTGDTIGATQQVSVMLVLCALATGV